MASIRRFLTFADLDRLDPRAWSISARLVAELADGRHIVLLDDRGWTSSGGVASQTSEEVESTARVVVGPDESWGDRTRAEMESGHWATLEQKLHAAGVDTARCDLAALVDDVEISDRLRRLLKPSDRN
jgi:hypothetical protein